MTVRLMLTVLTTPLLLALMFTVPQTAPAQSSVETIDAVAPKVVKIFGAGGLRGLVAYSTGFLVSPEGHIATVWSHVLDADAVTVVLDDGRRFQGKVLGAEPSLDLAVLKIEAEGLPYFDLEAAAAADPGTRVLAFGNMFKVATGDERVSVMHGVVSGMTKLSARRGAFEVPYQGPVYIVDAVVNNPGGGGGVVTTWDGRLLAMIGKELRNSESNTWVNYSMPIAELKPTIEDIITGRVRSSSQGEEPSTNPNRYDPLDFGIVLVPDLLNRTPAYIDHVLPGSPAAEAGLQPDDLVLFIGESLVQSVRMLDNAFGRLEGGDLLRLVVRRGDRLITAEFPVPQKPPR